MSDQRQMDLVDLVLWEPPPVTQNLSAGALGCLSKGRGPGEGGPIGGLTGLLTKRGAGLD